MSARVSTRMILGSLLVPLALAATLAGATIATAIPRTTVLARAQSWVDRPVPYSQKKKHLGYRTDCSGYVSMCWKTGTSWSTRTFRIVSRRISVADLQPGDAMLKKGYHIRLFYGWVDDTHTQYVAYEANTVVAVCRIHSLADDLAFGYVPTRYNRISASPKSLNLLRNGSFDTWAQAWGPSDQTPVWWQVDGPWWTALAAHRRDVFRSPRNSLELLNPSADPTVETELSQSATITAGASYRLSAWAKAGSLPATVTLSLSYLDATGTPLAETTTTASRFGVGPSSFRWMSVIATSPAGAVRARVSVRLAGGAATDASGNVVPGTSVFLDDISLVRPSVSVGMKASTATARAGSRAVLGGAVTPASAVGANAVLWIQRPGSAWAPLSSTTIQPSGGAGAWTRSVVFTRAMRRGVYRFRTAVPPVPGFLGATSNTVSITLK